MDHDLMALEREFVRLHAEKEELDRRFKQVKARLEELQAPLQTRFAQAGLQRLTLDGRTLYLHRQLWASPLDGDVDRLVVALQETGLDDFVKPTVNTQTLSAYVRELDEEELELPPVLAAAIKVAEVFSIRCLKAESPKHTKKGMIHDNDEDVEF